MASAIRIKAVYFQILVGALIFGIIVVQTDVFLKLFLAKQDLSAVLCISENKVFSLRCLMLRKRSEKITLTSVSQMVGKSVQIDSVFHQSLQTCYRNVADVEKIRYRRELVSLHLDKEDTLSKEAKAKLQQDEISNYLKGQVRENIVNEESFSTIKTSSSVSENVGIPKSGQIKSVHVRNGGLDRSRTNEPYSSFKDFINIVNDRQDILSINQVSTSPEDSKVTTNNGLDRPRTHEFNHFLKDDIPSISRLQYRPRTEIFNYPPKKSTITASTGVGISRMDRKNNFPQATTKNTLLLSRRNEPGLSPKISKIVSNGQLSGSNLGQSVILRNVLRPSVVGQRAAIPKTDVALYESNTKEKKEALRGESQPKQHTAEADTEKFSRVIEPLPDVCNGSAPFLLLLVASHPLHRMQRDKIRRMVAEVAPRKTQQQPDDTDGFKPRHRQPLQNTGTAAAGVNLLFFSGQDSHASGARKDTLLNEQASTRDLLLVNTSKTLQRHLPNKMAVALTWMFNCCPGTEFILTTTDDALIEAPSLLELTGVCYRQERSLRKTKDKVDRRVQAFIRTLEIQQKKTMQQLQEKHFGHHLSGRPSGNLPASYVISGKIVPDVLDAMTRVISPSAALGELVLEGVREGRVRGDAKLAGLWRIG